MKKARRDLADVTNAEQPGSSKKRKRTTPRSDAETEEISQLAKKFTIMKLFWLHDDRKTFRTPVDEQYDHLQRFENLESTIQGQIADILEVLPARYGDNIGNDAAWLSQTVSGFLGLLLYTRRSMQSVVSKCNDDSALQHLNTYSQTSWPFHLQLSGLRPIFCRGKIR